MTWNNCLKLVTNNRINEAYKSILETQDDLYLIRLMGKTGVCYEELDYSTATQLKNRVDEISKTTYIDNLIEEFQQENDDGKILDFNFQ